VEPLTQVNNEECLTGSIKNIIYYNSSKTYLIARVKLDQKKNEVIVITGNIKPENTTDLYHFYGVYVDHPTYGHQFKVSHYEKILPNSDTAIVKFLSSSLFPGVGVKAAAIIVDTLGEDCLNKIKNDSSVLDTVDIKPELKIIVSNGIKRQNNLNENLAFFVNAGFDTLTLLKMQAVYGERLYEIVENNPYQIIEDIDGVNLGVVDNYARSKGINERDVRRLEALIYKFALKSCYDSQDTYTDAHNIYNLICSPNRSIRNFMPLTDLTNDEFIEALNQAISDGLIVQEESRIFPRSLYEAETKIAQYLKHFITSYSYTVPKGVILDEIKNIEASSGISYSEDQKQAIIMCLNSGLSIITGGPGTGKTTVVNAIIRIYSSLFNNNRIEICAPTGRAAKRIGELADHSAQTIHRLLGWDLETNYFSINAGNPVTGDFLIVDEFSMVDCQLFYHLLDATQGFKKILLIGDEQQLPPVSPGDALRDLLQVTEIAKTELKTIHRQKEDSGIIPLCQDVRKSTLNENNLHKSDVAFYTCTNIEAKDAVLQLVSQAVSQGLDQMDIQVLAPKYDGVAGITELNRVIRDYFNPKTDFKDEIQIGTITYRVHDKILQLKNQPNDDVYNGDIGELKEIIHNPLQPDSTTLVIEFDGNEVTYKQANFVNISHAYCMSVHKSQGNEYKYVIMPVLPEYGFMLRRKLIYTGISRAKESLVILGDLNTLKKAVHREEIRDRKTSLKERIEQVLNS
jgi:exodeoxyribonuclease V alpha subunit